MEVGAGNILLYSTGVLLEARCQGVVRLRSGKTPKIHCSMKHLHHHLQGEGAQGRRDRNQRLPGSAGKPCTWVEIPCLLGMFCFLLGCSSPQSKVGLMLETWDSVLEWDNQGQCKSCAE